MAESRLTAEREADCRRWCVLAPEITTRVAREVFAELDATRKELDADKKRLFDVCLRLGAAEQDLIDLLASLPRCKCGATATYEWIEMLPRQPDRFACDTCKPGTNHVRITRTLPWAAVVRRLT